eukprot:359270-Chlamydomonas_euryale.AAC.2
MEPKHENFSHLGAAASCTVQAAGRAAQNRQRLHCSGCELLRRDVPGHIRKRRGRSGSAESRMVACSAADRWCAGLDQ